MQKFSILFGLRSTGHVDKVRNFLDLFLMDKFENFVNFSRYPTALKTPVFASGQIKSLQLPDTCIDMNGGNDFNPIGIYYCHPVNGSVESIQSQFFRLTFMKNINVGYMEQCLDSFALATPQCHYTEYGNQYWKYDHVNHMLINNNDEGASCLTGNFSGQAIYMKACDVTDMAQKWKFTYENLTALEDWKNIYTYERFSYGNRKINWDLTKPLTYDDECPNNVEESVE